MDAARQESRSLLILLNHKQAFDVLGPQSIAASSNVILLISHDIRAGFWLSPVSQLEQMFAARFEHGTAHGILPDVSTTSEADRMPPAEPSIAGVENYICIRCRVGVEKGCRWTRSGCCDGARWLGSLSKSLFDNGLNAEALSSHNSFTQGISNRTEMQIWPPSQRSRPLRAILKR